MNWEQKLDNWLRRHPRVMQLLVFVMTMLVTIVLLGEGSAPIILYEVF